MNVTITDEIKCHEFEREHENMEEFMEEFGERKWKGEVIHCIKISKKIKVIKKTGKHEMTDTFKDLKANNCKQRLLYSAKLFLNIDRETRTFLDKHKLRQSMTTKPELEIT